MRPLWREGGTHHEVIWKLRKKTREFQQMRGVSESEGGRNAPGRCGHWSVSVATQRFLVRSNLLQALTCIHRKIFEISFYHWKIVPWWLFGQLWALMYWLLWCSKAYSLFCPHINKNDKNLQAPMWTLCHEWTGSGQVKGVCWVRLGQGVKKQVWVHTEEAELGSASSTHQEGNQWYCIKQPQSHSLFQLEYNRKLEACTKWGGKQATIYSETPQHSFIAKQNFKMEKSASRHCFQRLDLLSSTVTEMGCFCWMVCVWGKRA